MPLRETTFISRNIESWRKLEVELKKAHPNPDQLNELYAAVVDDLSYARTHYPNRSVRAYLNVKASTLSLSLYRNRRGETSFRDFWLRTVPREVYAQRAPLLLAAALFLLCFLIGWGSAAVDPAFAELVLSEQYVEMTETNIAADDPMAVYKDGSRLGGALGIAGNNLWVSMLCFVSGLLAGVGTLFVLLRNGIMVGTFQQFFFERGVGWESVLGIWTHGTIEISCIIIAAGAGFVLARGILWPGTLSRSRAFQLTALSGLRIMAGIAPLIILAAIIEGFLTRMTELPTVFRVFFLLSNAAFIVYYFILLPRKVGAEGDREADDFGKLPPDRPIAWQPYQRLTSTQVFFETVRWMTKEGGGLVLTALGVAILSGLAWVLLFAPDPSNAVYEDFAPFGADVAALLSGVNLFSGLLIGGAVWASLVFATLRMHNGLPALQTTEEEVPVKKPLVAIAIVWGLLLAATTLSVWLAVLLLPLSLLWLRCLTALPHGFVGAFREAIKLQGKQLAETVLLAFMLLGACLLTGFALEQLMDSLVYPFVFMNLPETWITLFSIDQGLHLAGDLALLLVLMYAWTLAYGLLFHTAYERRHAEGLKAKVEALFPAS